MTGDDQPRIHRTCGRPMVATSFPHNTPTPQYRSQPTWTCTVCSAWEPREGWDGPLPAEWDGGQWRN